MSRPAYIDIHAHAQFADFEADRDAVIRRALDAGVWMINIGTGEETSKKAVELADAYPEGLYAIIGLHPIHVSEEDFDPAFYRALAKEKKVVGIGETGLDYFHTQDIKALSCQREAFIGQIELALELDLPLMLHIRSGAGKNAYRDALDILKSYKEKHGDRLRGDAHFFAGSVEEAKEFVALGFSLSFTGVVTFAKQYEELVRVTPQDLIMAETDCPYVAPVPERGKRNEPAFVVHTAEKIAALRGGDAAATRKALVDNAFRLFRL
jgi:TatD DNase family protein